MTWSLYTYIPTHQISFYSSLSLGGPSQVPLSAMSGILEEAPSASRLETKEEKPHAQPQRAQMKALSCWGLQQQKGAYPDPLYEPQPCTPWFQSSASRTLFVCEDSPICAASFWQLQKTLTINDPKLLHTNQALSLPHLSVACLFGSQYAHFLNLPSRVFASSTSQSFARGGPVSEKVWVPVPLRNRGCCGRRNSASFQELGTPTAHGFFNFTVEWEAVMFLSRKTKHVK